ncbi:hypothetical protein ABEB36_008230 [Hypothenemus hampei]|uniref:Uncharacterized protein n=1 Tax=Hypothenemus hampei TaxID=57062 RepID=A0ABD1EL67_HYPHA
MENFRELTEAEVNLEVTGNKSSLASTYTTASRDNVIITSTPTTNERRKRKKLQVNASNTDKMTDQALPVLQPSVGASNDPYITYALNMANELRKYDAQTRAHVKKAISNILFEADMGRIISCPIYGSNLHQHHACSSSSGTSNTVDRFCQTSSRPSSPV